MPFLRKTHTKRMLVLCCLQLNWGAPPYVYDALHGMPVSAVLVKQLFAASEDVLRRRDSRKEPLKPLLKAGCVCVLTGSNNCLA